MSAMNRLTEVEQRQLCVAIAGPTAQAVFADLPAQVQTLLKLALAENATREIQAEAAKTLINVTPITKLQVIALRLIVAAHELSNGEGA